MVRAFCPGHITCFFSPAGDVQGDLLARGSIGVGIRTSLGSFVEVTERSDDKVRIIIDGEPSKAPVTHHVFSEMAPGRGFDVIVEGQLPSGEGFGMSAAGAIAAALCLSDLLGLSESEAFETAHKADILGGGGLGDVAALTCLAHQPVRMKEGIPPLGHVVGTDVRFDDLTLAVLGPKMNTGNVLSDPEVRNLIFMAGSSAVVEYMKEPSLERLFEISNRFSLKTGLESPDVSEAILCLRREGYKAAMCMLGNSIFTDAPSDLVFDCLGLSDGVYSCSSTDGSPGLIHKA